MHLRHILLNTHIYRYLGNKTPKLPYYPLTCRRGYSSKSVPLLPPDLISLDSSNDMDSARKWGETFKGMTIPREAVELSFSRSSGPGGQVCVRAIHTSVIYYLTACFQEC